MELKKMTVEGFVQETSSSSPAPGGGSIAALNAASAAALIEMVAHLTLGMEKYAAVEKEMKEVAEKAASLKNQFLALIDEDSNAFNKIMAAFRMPKGSDEEKAVRSKAIQEATKGAALVPFKVGETANELFALADVVITRGNTNAVTDGAVAAMRELAGRLACRRERSRWEGTGPSWQSQSLKIKELPQWLRQFFLYGKTGSPPFFYCA